MKSIKALNGNVSLVVKNIFVLSVYKVLHTIHLEWCCLRCTQNIYCFPELRSNYILLQTPHPEPIANKRSGDWFSQLSKTEFSQVNPRDKLQLLVTLPSPNKGVWQQNKSLRMKLKITETPMLVQNSEIFKETDIILKTIIAIANLIKKILLQPKN